MEEKKRYTVPFHLPKQDTKLRKSGSLCAMCGTEMLDTYSLALPNKKIVQCPECGHEQMINVNEGECI